MKDSLRRVLFAVTHAVLLMIVSVARCSAADALEILEANCVRCHSGAKPKGGLDLVTREGLMRGGESGETLSATDPATSLLLRTVLHEIEPHMPYKEPKLPDSATRKLIQWVEAGAPYARPLNLNFAVKNSNKFLLTEADRRHWAFQPVRSVRPPTARDQQSQFENPIDQFVATKLEGNGLSFAPRASRRILIRRLSLNLTGLPPTPNEIEEFLADESPCAHERLIDRLLASPHYGERWGRHWLDLARYAETDGFEHDAVRPHAWRYRDYVIKSFNDDKPYDRFIREQLAGDELWPQDPEAVTATGFNLLGPDMVDSSDQIQRRHNTLNDMTDTIGLALLGLTIGCARCHDHKFEPITQHDYYALQAFFVPAKFEREKPIPTPQILIAYEAAMRELSQHPKMQELAAIESPIRERLLEKKFSQLSAEAQTAHRTAAELRTSEQANLVLETADRVKLSDKEVAEAFSDGEKQQHERIKNEVKNLPRPAALPQSMALGAIAGHRPKTFVLNRGEYSQPGDEVTPGFPEVLQNVAIGSPANPSLDVDRSDGDGSPPAIPPSETRTDINPARLRERAELADWIASRRNPLTARVIVNRIWQHHFGRGLVQTPSDFGTHGQLPTHPELLEWLANEFCIRGCSVKQAHRQMLTSATYRQVAVLESPQPSAGDLERWKFATTIDPDNHSYWRMNRLRLEGEAIRDSLPAVSGDLNCAMGGPGVFPPIPKELTAGSNGWTISESTAEHARRSEYIFARRNLRFPFLEVFDAPDNNQSCPVREGSTTAPQSLTLLNAVEVAQASKRMANRLQDEAKTTREQLELAFQLTLGRSPKQNELLLAREFLAESPLSEFCRALFNLNEFIYVE